MFKSNRAKVLCLALLIAPLEVAGSVEMLRLGGSAIQHEQAYFARRRAAAIAEFNREYDAAAARAIELNRRELARANRAAESRAARAGIDE